MPLLSIKTSLSQVSEEQSFLRSLSNKISELTGKPESYVMTTLEVNVPIFFAGNDSPACYVEIDSIGSLNPPLMAKEITNLIEEHIKIPPNRTYIKFEDIKASLWAHNGRTFG